MRNGGLLTLVAVLVSGVVAAEAPGAVFTVDTSNDRLDANAGDGSCATAAGKCALRAAIGEANALDGIDTIDLDDRTFDLTRPRENAESNDEGDLNLTEALIIEGAGRNQTTIRQTVNDRVILSNAEPDFVLPGAIIADLTVTGGRVTKAVDQSGGGILAQDNLLALDDVIVRDNSLVLEDINTFGGGIAQFAGQLDIQSSSIRDNRIALDSATGGAIGGGVFIESAVSVADIDDSRISGNRATTTGDNGTGGGLYVRGPTELGNSTVAGNRADGEGGGITVTQPDSSLQLASSTISGNRAPQGAGMRISTSNTVDVLNSTLSGNRSTSGAPDAGGAGAYVSFGLLSLTHATLARNRPRRDQATLQATGTVGNTEVEIERSVFANPRRECLAPAGFITTNELNVYQDANCLPAGLTTNLVATPKLEALAANPGPTPGPVTETHALKPASPAIDFVTSGCPPPSTDQRGLGRPQGLDCDGGSFERVVVP
jgi:hypothetical protein